MTKDICSSFSPTIRLTLCTWRVIVFFVLLAGTLPVAGQGLSFGVKGGLNIAGQRWIYPSGFVGYRLSHDVIPSLNAGFYFTAMFSRHAGIQAELQVSREGGKVHDGTNTYRNNLGYLNVPVVFRWQITPQFHLHAGPQVGMLLWAFYNGTSNYALTNKREFAAVIGGGVDFKNGMNAGVRFVNALTGMGDDDRGIQVRNYVLQFTIGYRLAGYRIFGK